MSHASLVNILLAHAQYGLTVTTVVCDSYRGGTHKSKEVTDATVIDIVTSGTDTGSVGARTPTGPSFCQHP
jgi:hypothetical protein